MAFHDYIFIMDFVENLLRTVVSYTDQTLTIPFNEHILNFAEPFKRITIKNAVIEFAHIQEEDLQENTIDATLNKLNISSNKTDSLGKKIYSIFLVW